ncbi:hypothetical protein CEXT_254291 [Caerostris extrusa]|uniref:Uncharacterized protein n=1 Tax=Caerostris extrusa TaxID=172846 RepID=A0AAV4U739_CAEEX|nr:hypothetical protein CEXT_254291 [Caerostris extrusa]
MNLIPPRQKSIDEACKVPALCGSQRARQVDSVLGRLNLIAARGHSRKTIAVFLWRAEHRFREGIFCLVLDGWFVLTSTSGAIRPLISDIRNSLFLGSLGPFFDKHPLPTAMSTCTSAFEKTLIKEIKGGTSHHFLLVKPSRSIVFTSVGCDQNLSFD